jgi:hypothetical protein
MKSNIYFKRMNVLINFYISFWQKKIKKKKKKKKKNFFFCNGFLKNNQIFTQIQLNRTQPSGSPRR